MILLDECHKKIARLDQQIGELRLLREEIERED